MLPARADAAPIGQAVAVEALLTDLARASIGRTFNQYRQSGPDDVAGAAEIRLANLRAYLEARRDADVLALGEAAGYQGMRWSGIAFTSERDLARWGSPFRPTSRGRKNGWSEPSGTIVHRVLDELDAERRVIVWNTVPTHPHKPGMPLSNRRPSVSEIAAGAVFVERILTIVRPRVIVAVGRVAEQILGPRATYVRHPANGGATAFAAGMARLLR
jgi:uracil-DNA glycosylase